MTAPVDGGPAGGLRGFLHSPAAKVGAVGAAGVVIYVLVKRNGSAASSSGDIAAGSSLAGTPGNPASVNTVGTDVASQLGQFEQAQQAALTEFGKTLNDALKGLNPPAAPPTASSPPKSSPPASTAKYDYATKYPSQKGTLSGIAAANKITLSQIEKLNPQITDPNKIYPGQKIRVA